MLSDVLDRSAEPPAEEALAKETAIEVRGVSKRYRRYAYRPTSLKGWVVDRLRGQGTRFEEFQALRDVSFTVPKGEMVGIVGNNGAGKSTLLKVLAGITRCDAGLVRVAGRVCPLLALGAGFAPELTGQQNIFLYGALLGLARREVGERLSAIVQFSGVTDFLHEPVKHYSSGMHLRLAFAVLAHIDADVLLLDEVLAVGDATFQEKCMERMREFRHAGKTIILVTHQLESVRSFCDRAILLEQGRIQEDGNPTRVLDVYLERLGSRS